MRVKFLQHAPAYGYGYAPGEEANIDDPKELLDAGIVEALPELKETKESKKAESRTKATKK